MGLIVATRLIEAIAPPAFWKSSITSDFALSTNSTRVLRRERYADRRRSHCVENGQQEASFMDSVTGMFIKL
jgi:hypothetical protein